MKFNNDFFNFFKGFYEKLTNNYQLELSKIEVKNEDDDVFSMSYKNFDNDFNGWSIYVDFQNADDEKFDMYVIIRKRVSGISYQINGFIDSVKYDNYSTYDVIFDYIDTISLMSQSLFKRTKGE